MLWEILWTILQTINDRNLQLYLLDSYHTMEFASFTTVDSQARYVKRC